LGVGLLPHPIKICSIEKLLKNRRRASKDCNAIIIIIISAGTDSVELAFFGYPD
jgi:hypothetical protein